MIRKESWVKLTRMAWGFKEQKVSRNKQKCDKILYDWSSLNQPAKNKWWAWESTCLSEQSSLRIFCCIVVISLTEQTQCMLWRIPSMNASIRFHMASLRFFWLVIVSLFNRKNRLLEMSKFILFQLQLPEDYCCHVLYKCCKGNYNSIYQIFF